MSLIAPVEQGKIVETTAQESTSSTRKTGANSVVSSDTFLTMLVAEMQNQDPLEPTTNTEWVSQYATFTMVEEVSEMGKSMDLMRANGLVGQNVIMKVTSESTGETNYVKGMVDYVVYENGKPYLYIDDEAYSLDDLDTVASPEYMSAYEKSSEFVNQFAKLPTLSNLTTSYASQIQDLWTLYDGMTDKEKGFISTTYVDALKKYKSAIEEMGVTINDAQKEATMNDLMSTFNDKMEALLASMNSLSKNVSGISNNVSDLTQTEKVDTKDSTEQAEETVEVKEDNTEETVEVKEDNTEETVEVKGDDKEETVEVKEDDKEDTETDSSDGEVTEV